MRTMVAIVKHIFVPVSAFLFLGIGFLACCYSGVIEYCVFEELLAIPKKSGSLIKPQIWPFILVLVLEGAKFTLHFYSSSLMKRNVRLALNKESSVKGLSWKINLLKYVLVFLSFLCSIIFVTNIFFNDNGKTETKKREQLALACDAAWKNGKADLELQIESKRKSYTAVYDYQKQRIDELYDKHTRLLEQIQNTSSSRQRLALQEAADALMEQINTEETNYSKNLQTAEEKSNEWYQAELKALDNRYGPKGSERKLSESYLEAEAMGDNLYLYTFLRAFSKTLYNHHYNRKTYFVWVLFLSCSIAAILEACIHISQTFLTMSAETYYEILGNCSVSLQEKKIIKIVAWTLFTIVCLLAIYIITGMCLNVQITRANIIRAAVSYFITIFLMNLIWGRRHPPLKEQGDSPIWQTLITVISDAMIPGILAFAGYVLIGFVFNGNFVYGDLNTLAIAVGGTLSQYFQKSKFAL